MMNKSLILLFVMLLNVNAAEVHVSPQGDDGNPGTEKKPFLTPGKARDALRQQKAAASVRRANTVILHAGSYRLLDSLNLDERDSDTTYCAAGDDEVIITGGVVVPVEGLKPVTEKRVLERIPKNVQGKVMQVVLPGKGPGGSEVWPLQFRGYAGWPELYVDGKPMHLARWPNDGYATIAKVLDPGSKPRRGDKTNKGGKFQFKEANPANWNSDEPIYLGGYWCYKWYDEFIRVESIDASNRQISMAAPHHYGLGGPSKGLYFAINLLEELDRPGEYVYDGGRHTLYMILPEDAGPTLHVSCLRRTLVDIKNVKNLTFKGIIFENGCQNGIAVTDCESVRIIDCTVRQISGTGIFVKNGKDCGIDACTIHTIGKAGVRLDGGDRQTLTPSKHFVTNSRIYEYARLQRTYCPAVGLRGVGQTAANNHFHDAPHQAVSFGGNDHRIVFNHIERVCQDTSDAGAIYCGRDWTMGGNVVHGNYIHDLGGSDHHPNWGIYLDDMASGIEVSSNLVVNTASGILIGGGRNNVIMGNVMINCTRNSIRYDARGAGWVSESRTWLNKPDGTMWQRLNSVPYKKGVWAERFPYLAKIEEDGYREPRRSTVTGNKLFAAEGMNLDKLVAKYGTVKDNTATDEGAEVVLEGGRLKVSDESLKSFTSMKIGP